MSFETLLGNDRLKKNLTESLARGHISHFYLISGPEGSGKHFAACRDLLKEQRKQGEGSFGYIFDPLEGYCHVLEIKAEGRKNSRLTERASWIPQPNTAVSQTIRRLPPPIPRPLRIPTI